MVRINHEVLQRAAESGLAGVVISHIIEIPSVACLFVSARDAKGRAVLFLVNVEGKIYERNGRLGSWQPVSEEDSFPLRRFIERAVGNPEIPCFSTRNTGGYRG